MSLSVFTSLAWSGKKDHRNYLDSILMPVAPEWTVGEVLLGAAYRSLVLGYQEGEVDRSAIDDHLLSELKPQDMWRDLLTLPGALASPRPAREHLGLKQLMPLVPEVALYAGALGRKRKGRWKPGNLLATAVQTGAGLEDWRGDLGQLAEALKVGPQDDLFARFVEIELRKVRTKELNLPTQVDLPGLYAPAWRDYQTGQRTPAERFTQDLRYVISLKPALTRRQWTVLVEALLRLGLAAHMLWICRLNEQVWALTLDALELGERPTAAEVEARCWIGHGPVDPLLELGSDAGTMIKKRIRGYAQARIGINLLLHAIDDTSGIRWSSPLGVSEEPTQPSPLKIAEFITFVADNATRISDQLNSGVGCGSARQFAGRIADANPKFLRADSGGVTKNLLEFLSHTLVAMNVGKADFEMASYDQAYIAVRQRSKAPNAPKYVRPGPATLILLVHACCRAQGDIPASIEDFRAYLGEYGISTPADELLSGATGRNMGALGLVVDSPDAGGGRLLVNPF